MKGPRGRHRYAIVRTWQCPNCQRTARSPGQVVNLRCTHCPESPWMRLIGDTQRRPAVFSFLPPLTT